jgi:TetR/AcrR family transcriptional regulator
VTLRSPSAADRLLAAALVEFARERKTGARTSRIARRAGVNKQLIHYYFHSKEGLYQAVLARAAEATGSAMGRIPVVGLTAVERLRRLIGAQFDFLLSHPDHTRLLVQAETGGEWADAAVQPVYAVLTEGQATGFFRDDLDPLHQARIALTLNLAYFGFRPITAAWSQPAPWRDRIAALMVQACSW